MPKTSKPSKKRIYSVKTYKARIERANARIKELEAKSKRLETSKTRITRLSTLIKQRDALEKAGDEKKLASFKKRYGKYLGNGQLRSPSDIRGLLRKLNSKLNMSSRAITSLHDRIDGYNSGMKIARQRERTKPKKAAK